MYFGTGNFCPDLNQNIFSCVRIWIGLKIRIHKNAQVQEEEEEEMFYHILALFVRFLQNLIKEHHLDPFRLVKN